MHGLRVKPTNFDYMKKNIVVLLFISFLFGSCVSRQKIAYFQNISSGAASDSNKYESVIQPDDLLMIIVSSPEPEAAIPFNLSTVAVLGNTPDVASGPVRFQNYLVDRNGYIQFPVLGSVKLGGLSREKALEKLVTEIKVYIKEPIVNLRIINFKISVIGEVNRPGSFNVATERVTLPEAISMAGDMTIYGKRDNVLVIRETNGVKNHVFVDMTKSDFINSPFYYLTQNDLVVVEPNKTRINSSAVGPNITVGISALSLLLTIIALATR